MLDESDPNGLLFIDLCRKGDLIQVEKMVQQGFDPNSYSNYEGWSPLFMAVKYNQIEIVKYLIQNQANIDQKTIVEETPLMHAAINNNLEIVKLLVQNKCDINLSNNEGSTALSYACYYGCKDVVSFLLKQKQINTDIVFNGIDEMKGKTPEEIAKQKGYLDIVQMFKSKL